MLARTWSPGAVPLAELLIRTVVVVGFAVVVPWLRIEKETLTVPFAPIEVGLTAMLIGIKSGSAYKLGQARDANKVITRILIGKTDLMGSPIIKPNLFTDRFSRLVHESDHAA